jgi:hypothetical protein
VIVESLLDYHAGFLNQSFTRVLPCVLQPTIVLQT